MHAPKFTIFTDKYLCRPKQCRPINTYSTILLFLFRKRPVPEYIPDPETAAAYAPGARGGHEAKKTKHPGLKFVYIFSFLATAAKEIYLFVHNRKLFNFEQ